MSINIWTVRRWVSLLWSAFCYLFVFPSLLGSRGNSTSIFLWKLFHSLIPLSRVFLNFIPDFTCSDEQGESCVTLSLGITIDSRDLSYLSVLFDTCWGLLCTGGFSQVLFRSSCSEITESTWTAVAQRGVGKCIHKASVFCQRERGRCSWCMAIALLWSPVHWVAAHMALEGV